MTRLGVFLDLINPIMTFDDPFRAIATLAPLAKSGHIRDFELRSVQQPDGYHRRGFDVRYRYPGEGVAPIRALIRALIDTVGDRPYDLLVEGLDSRADVDDQHERLAAAMDHLRYGAPGRRSVRAVVFTGAGDNDVVQVLERDDPTIAGDEVLVQVTVAGLNPADLQQREGRYPAPAGVVPDVPGLEVAGMVVAVGRTAPRWVSWRPGLRVGGGGRSRFDGSRYRSAV